MMGFDDDENLLETQFLGYHLKKKLNVTTKMYYLYLR